MYILLICGGIVSCGISYTSSVVGAYCNNSNISVRYTTEPFEVAMFSPSLKGRLSTWLTMPLL